MIKADLAHAVARGRRFRVQPISDTLEVSRSNLIRRLTQEETAMKPIQKADDYRLLPLIKEIVSRKSSYGNRRVTILLSKQLQSAGFQPVSWLSGIYGVSRSGSTIFSTR